MREKSKKPSRGRARDLQYSCLQFSQSSAMLAAWRSLFLKEAIQQGFREGETLKISQQGRVGRLTTECPEYSVPADGGKHRTPPE